MSSSEPPAFERAVQELARLPGVGEKTAERLAYHLLGQSPGIARSLAQALEDLVQETRECVECHHFAEGTLCRICENPKRSIAQICVVEMPQDLIRFEQILDYRGRYHVLGGRFAPLEGVFPENLNLDTLVRRIKSGGVEEVILALNPNTEGEATAELVTRTLEPHLGDITITRLATGLPHGAEIGFAGRGVLQDAFHRRTEVAPWR